MSEASFASLNPALLARKGGARPAMRPQLHTLPDSAETEGFDPEKLEDLGWNDMGSDEPELSQPAFEPPAQVPAVRTNTNANVFQLNPSADTEVEQERELIEQAPVSSPRREKKAQALPQPSPEQDAVDLSAVEEKDLAPVARSVTEKANRRAAFTLRLNTDRHLKLRLAATIQGKSAQAVVTEALDDFLDQIDGLDALAKRMKRH